MMTDPKTYDWKHASDTEVGLSAKSGIRQAVVEAARRKLKKVKKTK